MAREESGKSKKNLKEGGPKDAHQGGSGSGEFLGAEIWVHPGETRGRSRDVNGKKKQLEVTW